MILVIILRLENFVVLNVQWIYKIYDEKNSFGHCGKYNNDGYRLVFTRRWVFNYYRAYSDCLLFKIKDCWYINYNWATEDYYEKFIETHIKDRNGPLDRESWSGSSKLDYDNALTKE